jgi:hypothetical protein
MSGRAHIFVATVTVASLIFIIRLVRTHRLRAKYSMLWISVGLALTVLAVSPRLLDTVSGWLGVAYGPTTLFMVAITLLLLVAVHFSWELSRLEERTRILAEELAIRDARGPWKHDGEIVLPEAADLTDAGQSRPTETGQTTLS